MANKYRVNRRIVNYLNYESIRRFLKRNGIPISGLKSELIGKIETLINQGTMSRSIWNDYLEEQFRYGHNRTLYITKLNSQSLQKVKVKSLFHEALEKAGYPTEDFSDLTESLPESEEYELVYLKTEYEDQSVSRVEMCFANNIILKVVVDDVIIHESDTDFTWVELDLENEELLISLRPRSNTNEGSGKTYQTFNELSSLLKDMFSITYLSNDEMKTTLYNIFKELTRRAEEPYVEKVKPLLEEIDTISKKYARNLGLPDEKTPVNLPFRFKRLLERALIQNDFFAFKSYAEGKQGTIEKFFYADDTGARVNASANDGDGIEMSDIYFDTRETIDDQKTFNKLWVTWFLPENNVNKKVGSKLEVTSQYYLVHFYNYLLREECSHVLSTIKEFKQISD